MGYGISQLLLCKKQSQNLRDAHMTLQVGKGGSAARLMLAAGYDGNGSNIR